MPQELKPAQATLFLGAGASPAFGFPTTKEFLSNLAGTLQGKEKELLQAFTEVVGISDIEHVLEILDQVVELENPLLKYLDYRQVQVSTRPVYTGISTTPWKDFKSLATSLRSKIRTELFRQYEFEPKQRPTIQQRLHETLNAVCTKDCELVHLFTTNYDSVIEEGLTDSQTHEYRDGFSQAKYGQPAVWSHLAFDERIPTNKQTVVFLYKLHGSLSWRIDKASGNIVRVPTEEMTTENSRRFGENILIYPASKTPPILEPYGPLYGYFVQRLYSAKICAVIGYSFRDPYINTVFVNYLRRDAKNFLGILSPSADECTKNLLGSLASGPLGQQVLEVKERFGDAYSTSLISARIMGNLVPRTYEDHTPSGSSETNASSSKTQPKMLGKPPA